MRDKIVRRANSGHSIIKNCNGNAMLPKVIGTRVGS